MSEMRTIQFSGKRGARKLHIEAPGCIVNITKDLTDSEGRAVTSVAIHCDQYADEPKATMPDLCTIEEVAQIIARDYGIFDCLSLQQIEEYLRANLPTATSYNARVVRSNK